jgi:hypothetical protein
MRKHAYGLGAALAVVVAVGMGCDSAESVPAGQASGSTKASEALEQVGTVTFDGSTCSLETTADRIEAGLVRLEVVNATEKRAMFDSYQLLEAYTAQTFATTIERDRQRAEPSDFPEIGKEVSYLSSEIIAANSSGSVVTTLSPGDYTIVCMQPYRGEFRPFGVVGPIVVQ